MDNKQVLDLTDDDDVLNISFMDEADSASKYEANAESLRNELEEERNKLALLSKKLNKFLDNLKADPDKDTIKWPSRAADIEKFQKQINQIIKGN